MVNTLSKIVAFIICICLVIVELVFKPAVVTDKLALTRVNTVASDFVTSVRTSGMVTKEDCEKLFSGLDSTGNKYVIQIDYKHNMPYNDPTSTTSWITAYDSYSEKQILPLVYGAIPNSYTVANNTLYKIQDTNLTKHYGNTTAAKGSTNYKPCPFYMHKGDSIRVTIINSTITQAMSLSKITGGYIRPEQIYAQYSGVIMNEDN